MCVFWYANGDLVKKKGLLSIRCCLRVSTLYSNFVASFFKRYFLNFSPILLHLHLSYSYISIFLRELTTIDRP